MPAPTLSVYINYRKASGDFIYVAKQEGEGNNKAAWTNQAYRTIIFDEEPTGDLLTWLQANATPQ